MELKITGSKIVIADDSPTIVSKLELMLKKQGYQVFSALDGEKCLQLVSEVDPDLILLDLDMPKVNGLDVCKVIRHDEKTSLTPVIILTASGSKDDKNRALAAGANDMLYKNYDNIELKLKVESLLKLKYAIDQLENANNIIKSLAKTVEVKDKYTVGHAERVSFIATTIARKMKFHEAQLKDITMAGLLHDIGKIGVPDLILNKEGKLTDEEFTIIKNHPVIGEEICNPIKSFEKVKQIIRHHHEKLNGKGYPDGLKGDQINIETRIMTVADIYDALTSDRSYRKSMTKEDAFNILKSLVERDEIDGSIVSVLEKVV
ncbi:MAG: response regulator [Clostridia bacterium]|nr:response regulator [Clostridia bacterium]